MQCTSLGVGGDGDGRSREANVELVDRDHSYGVARIRQSHTHEAGRGRQARRELAGGNRHGHAAVGKIYRKVKCRITAKRAWPICRPACLPSACREEGKLRQAVSLSSASQRQVSPDGRILRQTKQQLMERLVRSSKFRSCNKRRHPGAGQLVGLWT